MSGRPPPEPPTICATGRMRSPALNLSVSDLETAQTSAAFGALRGTDDDDSVTELVAERLGELAEHGPAPYRRRARSAACPGRSRADAVRSSRPPLPPAPPSEGDLALELGDLLLEGTIALHELLELVLELRAGAAFTRRAAPRSVDSSPRTYETAFIPVRRRCGARRRRRRLAHDLEEPDVAERARVGAAAELDRVGRHREHAHGVAVLLLEDRHGAALLRLVDRRAPR
jgi:hypothetical protein